MTIDMQGAVVDGVLNGSAPYFVWLLKVAARNREKPKLINMRSTGAPSLDFTWLPVKRSEALLNA